MEKPWKTKKPDFDCLTGIIVQMVVILVMIGGGMEAATNEQEKNLKLGLEKISTHGQTQRNTVLKVLRMPR